MEATEEFKEGDKVRLIGEGWGADLIGEEDERGKIATVTKVVEGFVFYRVEGYVGDFVMCRGWEVEKV